MQRKALYGLLFAGLLLAPWLGAYPVFVMKVLCFALFAAAFNLLIGYTGLLSFGHAMFLATAGYATGFTIQSLGFSPLLGVLAGTVAATLLGAVGGLFAIRRQGIYFAMVTLAFAQMIYFIYLQTPFTHGEDGLQGVPRGTLFGFVDLSSDLALYYVVLVGVALAFALIVRIIHSPFGQVMTAIRENEPRAISLGYRVDRYKLLVFVLSATIAGLAGATKAVVFQIASLSDVANSTSASVILMTLLGGLGSVFGPVVGAFVIVAIENYMSSFGAWITVIEGLIFVVCVLSFRQGLVGQLAKVVGKPL